jgi:hypothetical protein
MVDSRRDAQTQWLALIAEQGKAERQATQHHAAPALDLTGDLAAARNARNADVPSVTREQAQTEWLKFGTAIAREPSEAAKASPGKETPADDDHAL